VVAEGVRRVTRSQTVALGLGLVVIFAVAVVAGIGGEEGLKFLGSAVVRDILGNLIGTIVGAVIGAYLAYLFALRMFEHQAGREDEKMRVDTASAFYDEFTREDFAKARSDANNVFEELFISQHIEDADSFDAGWSDMPGEQKQPILKVLSFFRRLQAVTGYELIDHQMALDLLSEEFYWWYFRWLDQMIPDGWDTRQRIDGLDRWFRSSMPKTEYDQLKNEMVREREERIRQLRSNQQN
jgi:hypothetical protein